MRDERQSAFLNITDHRKYVLRRNHNILTAWRDEGHTWVEIAERSGLSLRQVQRAAIKANNGLWPERRQSEAVASD